MDQIPMGIAAIIGTALVAALGILWKVNTTANQNKDRECKARVAALETKVADIYTMLVKKADIEVTKTEQREQRAWDRALELSKVLERVSEITKHAIRIIRRHEPDAEVTPLPRSHAFEPTNDHTSHQSHERVNHPSYEQRGSDETSRFLKDHS